MNKKWSNSVLAWITRVLAVLFVALTAYGWWDESQARQGPSSGGGPTDWLWEWAVLTHLLPLVLIIAATAVGWRWPAYGALGFLIFAVLQAISVGTEWAYLPIVVAPPVVITVLFVVGWALGLRAGRGTSQS